MAAQVNCVISPFERNINIGYSQGIKIYLQATKYIDKESEKLYIPVSNSKDITYNFLSLDKKYGWGIFSFMVDTVAGNKNIFCQVEQINIADMYHQAPG